MSYESPQMRRLRSDLAALERLQDESSIIRFRAFGKPAQRYVVEFRGRGLARDGRGKVRFQEEHALEIKLGSSYPRTMPEMRWLSPIYHPNISEVGLVCLGGYGTHWVPSLHLDDLCVMIWDMIRYHNYDIRSPYNRDAALWAANQTTFAFPVDARPLRDIRVAQGRIEEDIVLEIDEVPAPPPARGSGPHPAPAGQATAASGLDAGEPELIQPELVLEIDADEGPHTPRPAVPPPSPVAPRAQQPVPEVVFLD